MNYKKLNQKVEASGMTKVFIANQLGISTQGLYYKLNGKNDWTRREVEILCDILHIVDLIEKESIFFSPGVD